MPDTLSDPDSTVALTEKIHALREEMNAVILAHYYQVPELQDIADFIGDSLDLSRKAAATDADVIVFCGVRFMAETAKILSPERLVLIPDLEAGCSLEESCPAQEFQSFREAHPGHMALTYINCSVEVKALSDIIVTSSNVQHIVKQIPAEQPILFSPDKNLGEYISRHSGRDMLLWPGTCVVHRQFSEEAVINLKSEHPKAHIIAHPECTQELLAHAEHIGSTSSLLQFVVDHRGDSFIVLTEPGILHQMRKRSPGSIFFEVPGTEEGCTEHNYCPYMKRNTLEKLYLCMAERRPAIEVDADLRRRALIPLNKMLEMSL